MNRNFYTASSPISQSFFFEEVRCLIFVALWIHRTFQILYHDKKIKKIQIRLKLEGPDRFSQYLVSDITQY